MTTTVGNSVSTGMFGTNGKNKYVVISVSRYHRRIKGSQGASGFVAGAGANSMTIHVYCTVKGGNEALWTSFTARGGVDITNETDGPDIANSAWSGSITLNDSANVRWTVPAALKSWLTTSSR